MKIARSNEVLRDLDWAGQCAYAAALGYDGLEVAPFTLDAAPHQLSAGRRAALRRAAADAGIAVTVLDWRSRRRATVHPAARRSFSEPRRQIQEQELPRGQILRLTAGR